MHIKKSGALRVTGKITPQLCLYSDTKFIEVTEVQNLNLLDCNRHYGCTDELVTHALTHTYDIWTHPTGIYRIDFWQLHAKDHVDTNGKVHNTLTCPFTDSH